MNTVSSPCLTAFLTVLGVDLVLRDENGDQTRASLSYDSGLSGMLGDDTVVVEFTTNDAVLTATVGDSEVTLRLQPKGHYFGWLKPLVSAARVDIATARRLAAAASAERAAATEAARKAALAAARKGNGKRQVLQPDATDPNDAIGF